MMTNQMLAGWKNNGGVEKTTSKIGWFFKDV